MERKLRLFISRLLILCLAASLLFVGGCAQQNKEENGQLGKDATDVLFAYVGANLKEPFVDLAKAYEEKTGVKIEVTYNNSGALLNQVETAQKGDIFMPGGMPFIDKAKEKGFIEEIAGPIAYHTPVIVVPKDNSANITSIYDLANPGVKLLVPDLEATAIGKTVDKVFSKTEKSEEIKQNIIANLESPPKVMAAIKMGQGNAGIVEYSNVLKDKDNVNIVEIDPKINIVDEIPIASLTFAKDKEQAKDFINFVKKEGPQAFEKYGFKIKK